MKKKVAFILALSSFISLGQVIPVTKTFAEETKVVQQNQSTIQKELQDSWQGQTKDPDNEITLQPGQTAPLPNRIKEIEETNKANAIKANANNKDKKTNIVPDENGTTSFVNQMAFMSKQSYKSVPATYSLGAWKLYDTYTDPATSFTAYVYRQPYYGENGFTGTYGYTIAFRGTNDGTDKIVDVKQVGLNIGGLQAEQAVLFTQRVINNNRNQMHHLYLTGHSLGGYLAQWVHSEMLSRNITRGETFTTTFNAPGLSEVIFSLNTDYRRAVLLKLGLDKKGYYNDYIYNYRISRDLVSKFGNNLGKVLSYNSLGRGGPGYYHDLDRILELGL